VPLAKKLGAAVYIDSHSKNPGEKLQEFGGAQAILATAPSSKAMSELVGGLGPNGKLMLIGVAFDPIEVARYSSSTEVRLLRAGVTERQRTRRRHSSSPNSRARVQ
jgi:D-arabinose 1-dehydrogenase-like Zn-dependent alcohol dehydrogenase